MVPSLGWAMQVCERGASSSASGPQHPPLLPRSPPPESWGLHVKLVGTRALEGGQPRGLQVWISGWAAWAAAFRFQTPGRKGGLWPAICPHKRNLRISSNDRTRSPGFQRMDLDPVPILATKLWSLTQLEGHSGNSGPRENGDGKAIEQW